MDFSILKGETLVYFKIKNRELQNSQIIMETMSGKAYILYNEVRAEVTITNIIVTGDIENILYSEILLSECLITIDSLDESIIFREYKISTTKGSLSILWVGELVYWENGIGFINFYETENRNEKITRLENEINLGNKNFNKNNQKLIKLQKENKILQNEVTLLKGNIEILNIKLEIEKLINKGALKKTIKKLNDENQTIITYTKNNIYNVINDSLIKMINLYKNNLWFKNYVIMGNGEPKFYITDLVKEYIFREYKKNNYYINSSTLDNEFHGYDYEILNKKDGLILKFGVISSLYVTMNLTEEV